MNNAAPTERKYILPEWLSWPIVRIMHWKYPVVEVSHLLGQYVGKGVNFSKAGRAGQRYKAIVSRRTKKGYTVIAEKIK